MQLRRSIAVGLAAALVSPLASAALFFDISGRADEEAILGLASRGIVEGYEDSTFRPLAPINRAEFIKILVESQFKGHTPKDLRCFKDLDVKTPQWYALSVCSAQELGIVNGYPDGTFKPDRSVNLAEALKMAFRTFGVIPTPDATSAWYGPYLNEARNRGILISLLKNPTHLLTRGEMALLTFALVAAKEDEADHPSKKPAEAVCGNSVVEHGEQCDDGNTLDSDGCSSICFLVPEPVRRAFLRIDEQATGVVNTVAQGQRRIPLLKFTAIAGRQDAILTSLTLEPTAGSLLFAKHYTLLMDRDGTGTYSSVAQADGRTDQSTLTFDHLVGGGILIPKDLTVPFEIVGDLVSTLGPVSLGIDFAFGKADFVQAQGAIDGIALTGIQRNGTCASADCFITVNTNANQNINVIERGNLWVTEDSVTPQNHLLLGGTITPALLRLRMRSDGESIDVHQLRIDGVTNDIDSLLFFRLSPGQTFDPVGSQPFAQATNGQCPEQSQSRVCAVLSLSTLVIQPNQEAVIVIAAKMKTDQLGGISGHGLTLSLSTATDTSGHAVDARGISSVQDLSQNNGDAAATGEVFIGTSSPAANREILGRTDDTTMAEISSISNGATDHETFIPSGSATIGAFTISAYPHGNTFQGSKDVVLKTMTFQVSAQNVQIDPASYRLITKDNPSSTLPCSAAGTTGTITVTCSGIDAGSLQSHVNQGQWVIYQLLANVTNTQIGSGTSSLSVTLPILGTRSQTNSILWSDQTTTFTWVDIPQTSVQSTLYQTR